MGKSGIKMWKRKILVIESSAADYAEIEEILGETYELRRAEPEKREVFTRIREQKPDLILLDTRLPGEGFFSDHGSDHRKCGYSRDPGRIYRRGRKAGKPGAWI